MSEPSSNRATDCLSERDSLPELEDLLAHDAQYLLSRAEELVERGVGVTRAIREELDLPDYVAVGAGWSVIESHILEHRWFGQTEHRGAVFSAFARRLGESEDQVNELQSRYEDVRTRMRELTSKSAALLE